MHNKTLNLAATPEDAKKIAAIVERAAGICSIPVDMVSVSMDITAVHLNDCRLDLDRLLAAKDTDFGHDVFGIVLYLNRNTGKLEDSFLPRFIEKAEIAGCPYG